MQYATRSRHGIWKYRRAIPQALRRAAGKREIIVSLLTKDDSEAQPAYVKAHGDAEGYLASLKRMVANPKSEANDNDIWKLGQAFLQKLRLPYVPLADLRTQDLYDEGPTQLEQRLEYVETQLGIDMGDDWRDRDRRIEASLEAKAVLGVLKQPKFCISDALRVYFDQRAPELSAKSPLQRRRYRLDKERAINSLKVAIGEDKSISTLTRSDARTLRDYFRARGLAISTVNKHMATVATIWKVAAQDQDLTSANPFTGHTINDPIPEIEKRNPLSNDEIALLLGRRSHMNVELASILTLLAYTGARIAEITGLRSNDFIRGDKGGIPHIIIKPNHLRNLKNHSSRRSLPVLGDALKSLLLISANIPANSEQPIFERYSKDRGPTNASAALMKQLRSAGIVDEQKAIHSLRHSVKQALRDSGCPKDVSDAIQGHSTGDASASYGSGLGLKVMKMWLQNAYGQISVLSDKCE